MKGRILLSVLIFIIGSVTSAQKLIIRGDDIGCTHGSNVGVIKSYTDGIERSAELMVVTPWLPEAVKMINEQPGLDVGVHVALTSEWETMKWRPLTHCPSLTDENGYFFPMTFPNKEYPGQSLTEQKAQINLGEVEAELRAQIELAQKLIPNLTHISGHMGWAMVHEGIPPIAKRLSEEYNLPFVDDTGETNKDLGIVSFPLGWGLTPDQRETKFIEALGKLEKGKTYIYVEHPAEDSKEMQAIFHKGYENVAEDRQAVLKMFTSPVVKKAIEDNGIELVGYGDVIRSVKK